MKKNLMVIILAVLFHTSLLAQSSECQYDRNEVDKFTNKKIIWTKWEHLSPLISREYAPDVRGVVEDTVKQILFYVNKYHFTNDKPTEEGINNYIVVPPGAKALLLLENGKTLELTTDKEIHSTGNYDLPRRGGNNSDQFRINYHVTMMYRLTKDAIKTLAGAGVTNIRIYYKAENFEDYTVAKKKTATVQNLMNCIQ